MGIAVGCAPDPASSEASDESAITAEGTLTLSEVLPEADSLGITDATVRKVFDKRFIELPSEFGENKSYLEVTFPSLDEAQFDGLKKLFGGRSKVPFEAGKA